MNHIVDRESVAMKAFSAEALHLASEMEAASVHLRHCLYDASDNMQDASGQEAIFIVHDTVDSVLVIVEMIRNLADQIAKSADLLEASDELL